MAKIFMGIALLLAVGGCEPHASARPVRGPDGTTWYAIRCGGDPTVCYERAGDTCPGGYDVGDSSDQQGAVARHFGSALIVRPTFRGQLLVRCKGAASAAADDR